MITSVNFKRFRISEFIQFFFDIITICKQNNPQELNFKNQFNALNLAQADLNKSFKQSQKSEITVQIFELDERRDKAYICINKLTDGYLNHFDSEKQEAARQISECISKYGSKIYDLNYQAETSVLSSLGKELNNGLSSAMKTLNLLDVNEEMIRSNNSFNSKFIERIEESAADNTLSSGELTKNTIDKFRLLCKHIEAYATISPSVAYSNLISQLNSLINRYNSTMAYRVNSKNEEVSLIGSEE